MPRISVIVPVYKVEQYLDRCVQSILKQTYTDFELILVDDGSPDRCGEMCDEYAKQDERIVVIHQENGGLSAARNAGIDWAFANSDSEWLHFVDSDDWIHSRMLELLYNATEEHQVKIALCDYFKSSKTEPDELSFDEAEYDSIKMTPTQVYEYKLELIDFTVAKLYKKELFETLRYPVSYLFEDAWTTYRAMFAVDEVALIKGKMYCYYINPTSITNSEWTPAWIKALEAHEEQLRFFRNNGFIQAFDRGVRVYYWTLVRQLEPIRTCSYPDKKRYEALYMKKIRRVLRKYKHSFPKDEYQGLWEFYHPKMSAVLGLWRGLQSRLKKH